MGAEDGLFEPTSDGLLSFQHGDFTVRLPRTRRAWRAKSPMRSMKLFHSAIAELAKRRASQRSVGKHMEELGSIYADARKVKQIVYNLLSNCGEVHRGGRPGNP